MASSAMKAAIQSDNLQKVMQLFQSEGAEENSAKDNTLLYFSAMYSYSITRYFLDQGCDPNRSSVNKHTMFPLEAASSFAKEDQALDICQLLVERGARLDAISDEGTTPLHSAVIRGMPKVVNYLLKQGADPNHQDNAGYTPLLAVMQFRARNYRHLFIIDDAVRAIIKALLEEPGADPTLSNNQGKTVESYLTAHEECSEVLSDDKADIEAVKAIREWVEKAKQYQANIKFRL